MSFVRAGIRLLFRSLLAIVLLVVAALALVQTEVARERLEPLLGRALSTPTAKIEISGLRFQLPLELGLDRLRLADAAGVWLELAGAHLELRPRALLEGRIAVADLSATELAVHRIPRDQNAEPEPPAQPLRLDRIMAGLPELSVDRLRVDRIVIGEPVMGQPLGLRLDGALAALADGEQVGLRALVERTDGAIGKVELAGRLIPAADELDLRLTITDHGGLVAALAKEPRIGLVDLELTGRGPLDRWLGTLSAVVEGLGRAEGNVQLALTETPAIDLALSLRPDGSLVPAKLEPVVGPSLEVEIAAGQKADGGVVVTRLQIDSAAVSVASTGLTLTGDGGISGEITIAAADLAKLSELAGAELAGRAEIVLTPTGTIEAPSVHLAVAASGLRTAAVPIDAVAGELTAIGRGVQAENGVDVKGLDVSIDELGTRLAGDLGLGGDGTINGRIKLSVSDLEPVGKLVERPLGGKLELTLVPTGSLQAARAELAGKIEGLVVDGHRLGALDLVIDAEHSETQSTAQLTMELGPSHLRSRLEAKARLEGDELQVSGLKLTGPQIAFAGHGKLDIESLRGRAELDGRIADLAALAPLLGPGLGGSIELKASLEEVEGKHAAKLSLGIDRLTAAGAQVRSARLEARAPDLSQAGPISATLDLAELRSGETIVERGRIQLAGPLTGPAIELDIAGSATGHPFTLAARAQTTATEARQSLRIDSLSGRFAGEPIELTRPATIERVGATIDVGKLELKLGAARATVGARLTPETVQAELGVDGLPLAMLESFGAPALIGKAKLQASLSGRPDAPDLTGTLDLTGLSPTGDSKQADIAAAIKARLADGRDLRVESRITGLGTTPITADVRLPLRLALEPFALSLGPETPLEGKIGGEVQLARVGQILVLDGQKLGGTAKLDLKLGGSVGKPGLSGRIELRQGLVEDATSGFSLRQIQATIVARNEKVVIERLSGRDRGKGEITGTGELDLQTLAYSVDLKAKEFEAVRLDLARATVSGTAQLRGDDGKANLRSRLEVVSADIGLPDVGPSPPATIKVREIGGTRPETFPEPSAGPPFIVGLDVVVDLPGQVFVRGRGLDSEWKGKLRVKGSSAEPDVTGELESKRGVLDFLGTRFAVAESKIRFDGARPPVPALDIVAKAKKTDITAIVRVRGRGGKPEITFESDPTMPRDEILSRVLFNKDMSGITPLQAASLANAVATLEGGGVDILAKLRQSTGLDTLDVGGDGTTEAAAARAGKYLSDDIYLEVQKGLSEESSKARVEIDLGRNLKATTEVTETSQTGVRLEWKYDY